MRSGGRSTCFSVFLQEVPEGAAWSPTSAPSSVTPTLTSPRGVQRSPIAESAATCEEHGINEVLQYGSRMEPVQTKVLCGAFSTFIDADFIDEHVTN